MTQVLFEETSTITAAIQGNLSDTRVAGGSIAGENAAGDGAASTATSNSDEASADEGGDEEEESADSGGGESGPAGGGPNVLIDTSRIAGGSAAIDTPITSTGNSSLWSGADGLIDGPGGIQ